MLFVLLRITSYNVCYTKLLRIEDLAANVHESSSTIEQLVRNISSITTNITNVGKNYVQLKEVSDSGRDKISTVTEQINEVAQSSEALIETINVSYNFV